MLGSTATLYALLLYLTQEGASPTQVALVLVARALPQALGPLAGTLSDRVDARKVMVACDLGQAACAGALALLLPPYWLLVALVAAYSVFSALFLPAGKGAIPKVVARDDLTTANTLMGSSFNLAVAAGPAVGAFLVAGPGARAAFALDAATFLLSAFLVSRLPSLAPETPQGQAVGTGAAPGGAGAFASEVREGLSYVLSHRVARAVALGLFLSVAFAALDNVALVYMVTDTLGASGTYYGLSGTAYGAAMILAPLLLLRLPGTADAPNRVLLFGLALTGAGLVLGGLAPSLALFVLFYLVAGAGNGLENVACDTLVGRTVEPSKLGRVFGAVYGPIFLADALAAAIGGLLLAATSARTVFMVAGCGVLAVLLLVRTMLPRSLERNGVG
jgi:MFS family permease